MQEWVIYLGPGVGVLLVVALLGPILVDLKRTDPALGGAASLTI